jgi:hypothetical protein
MSDLNATPRSDAVWQLVVDEYADKHELHELSIKLERQLNAATEALEDCRSGLVYIRQRYGSLDGVGFDRAIDAADKALRQLESEDGNPAPEIFPGTMAKLNALSIKEQP